MGSRGKYKKLEEYLRIVGDNTVKLSFCEIENILGFSLEPSAYKYPACWGNTNSYGLAAAWLRAGYRAEQLRLIEQTVIFRKSTEQGLDPDREPFKNRRTLEGSMPANKAVDLIRKYYSIIDEDEHGRYLSWEHCYAAFRQYRHTQGNEVVDYLSLQLAFYLASWGMYRGSSFLLQKDYRVHVPVVEILRERRYDTLMGISAKELVKAENINLIIDASNRIRVCYAEEKPAIPGAINHATDTLITKILLGTLGCIPAYDRYYIAAVKENHISSGMFNRRSVFDIADYYHRNECVFEPLRKEISSEGLEYPAMKLMDMCFWQDGFEKAL